MCPVTSIRRAYLARGQFDRSSQRAQLRSHLQKVFVSVPIVGPAGPTLKTPAAEQMQEAFPPVSDEKYQSPWPRPLPKERISELPDSLSWGKEAPLPVVRTKRRATFAPGVDRPQTPILPQ